MRQSQNKLRRLEKAVEAKESSQPASTVSRLAHVEAGLVLPAARCLTLLLDPYPPAFLDITSPAGGKA